MDPATPIVTTSPGVPPERPAEPPSSPTLLPPTDEEEISRCAICLDTVHDLAYVDHCFHPYCFPCITAWCSVDTRCPLCQGRITALIYDIQGQFHRVLPVEQPALGDLVSVRRPEDSQIVLSIQRNRAFANDGPSTALD
ncbi:hypothetical protein H4R33_004062 [Dimargaris cristalligena]|nr:hypothetical protein H4R33_004062 [Dimargaris cristalligena]